MTSCGSVTPSCGRSQWSIRISASEPSLELCARWVLGVASSSAAFGLLAAVTIIDSWPARNSMNPPVLATWLLERFAIQESVIGDLIEGYQKGKSSPWFWRQTLTAVAVKVAHEIRDDRLLAVRAVLLGCA